MTGSLGVIATAGHVDHGKSALIVALTGIDPDRFEEEKRRGLTIDLGYAWTTLPSGREIGFVDVPGHERFIRNMLAGVGPVRLVLFVVAADEGWKPQSEEHLQILDVLGVAGGVIASTKTDLVDDETLELATAEVRERVAGSVLDRAPIVPVSARTGTGLDALITALDRMVLAAPGARGGARPAVRRPGLLDHRRGHRRHGDADRRLSAGRRRGRPGARRRAHAGPVTADAQARARRGLPRLAGRRQPDRDRPRDRSDGGRWSASRRRSARRASPTRSCARSAVSIACRSVAHSSCMRARRRRRLGSACSNGGRTARC